MIWELAVSGGALLYTAAYLIFSLAARAVHALREWWLDATDFDVVTRIAPYTVDPALIEDREVAWLEELLALPTREGPGELAA